MMIFLLLMLLAAATAEETIEDLVRNDPDLSQIYSHLHNSSLRLRDMTIFAPTNEAFRRFGRTVSEDLIHYHVSKSAVDLDDLGTMINTETVGNAPLWMTRREGDVFINSAKVLRSYVYEGRVLHVIDRVLVPPLSSTGPFNPDAHQFLFNCEKFDTGNHILRSFRQRVQILKKEYCFSAIGTHTFFVYIGEAFKHSRLESVDQSVIYGHIIPDQVLFTRAAPSDRLYQTLAYTDNLKVTVKFMNGRDAHYVQSNTLVGDARHPQGVVIAEIVQSDIPLRNGVMHLIRRPLMISDTTVAQFVNSLSENEDGPLSKFYEVIMSMKDDLVQRLAKMRVVTLFAPTNEAWSNVDLSKHNLMEILNLHVVKEWLPLDKIIHKNIQNVRTEADRKRLYLNVYNQTLTVEGGGVNATVIQPNIIASNGFIHIIDRVLGVPTNSVLEKLKMDPALHETYLLGRQFNSQLNTTANRFTYFAPRNEAWSKLQINTLHKKWLGSHVKPILGRHLIVSDRAFTMDDIMVLANDTLHAVFPTNKGVLRIGIKKVDDDYYVKWQNEWIRVSKPDVECTNGIIHVIDHPFVKKHTVNEGADASGMAPLLSHLLPTALHNILINIME